MKFWFSPLQLQFQGLSYEIKPLQALKENINSKNTPNFLEFLKLDLNVKDNQA